MSQTFETNDAIIMSSFLYLFLQLHNSGKNRADLS